MKNNTRPLPRSRRLFRGRWALKMIAEEGKSINGIARQWNVCDATVKRWINEAKNAELRVDGKIGRSNGGQKEPRLRKLVSKCWAHHGGSFPVRYIERPDRDCSGDSADSGQTGKDSK